MLVKTAVDSVFASYLGKLRELEFAKSVRFKATSDHADFETDGVLTIETPRGKYSFSVEHKNSYLDRAVLNAFIVQAKHFAGKSRPLLLFARYIPRPAADRLMQAGVNFLDQTGNIHLSLGGNYVRTVLGNKEATRAMDTKSVTPAKVQLLFTLAAHEDTALTVRELAEASGLSKSNVAKLRPQIIDQHFLSSNGESSDSRSKKALADHLVRGYEEVLRPKLLFNRFRSGESSMTDAMERLRPRFAEQSARWSLTGGAAAFELQRFYKGPELVLFVDKPTTQLTQALRLFPDREGPITFLQGFGRLTYWQTKDDNVIAHPWLIYAELMRSTDPRAHEAAEELKGQFLRT